MDADKIRHDVFHDAISDEQWARVEERVEALPWREICHQYGIFDVTGLKESMRIAIGARVVAEEIEVTGRMTEAVVDTLGPFRFEDGPIIDATAGEKAVRVAGALLEILEKNGIERHMPDAAILEQYAKQEAEGD